MISKALEDEEARRLEHAAVNRRDLKGLAVIIGLYLGLRRFEIVGLRWADFHDDWVTLIGKGDVEATLPVHQVVRDYLAVMPRTGEFLFAGRFGGSANPTTIWGWAKDVSREAGLGPVPTHVLRHTALSVGNDVTGDLRAAQDFARHAQIETTAGYTRTTKRRLLAFSEAIAGAYRDPDPDPVEDPDVLGPTLPFAELVATVEGAHAVRAWSELARVMAQRPGWRFAGSMEGEGVIRFEYSPLLHAEVQTWTNERKGTFQIVRMAGPDSEDFDVWDFPDALTLGVVAASFESGGTPFPPNMNFRESESLR